MQSINIPQGVTLHFEERFGTIYGWIDKDGTEVGFLVAQTIKGTCQILEINCYCKGLGKLLYYGLMDYIYPIYLKAGFVVSSAAYRIWRHFDTYCESRKDDARNQSYAKIQNGDSFDWLLIDKQYRFKFKKD